METTHSTWTMETTHSLYMDHGGHTSTTHGPCMNTHPLHSDHVWIHTHATQTIQELTPTPYRSCISASPKTSLSNTSLKSKDVLSTCTLAASWDEGKQRTFVRYGHSIWLQPSCFMLCYFFKRISYQLKKGGEGILGVFPLSDPIPCLPPLSIKQSRHMEEKLKVWWPSCQSYSCSWSWHLPLQATLKSPGTTN